MTAAHQRAAKRRMNEALAASKGRERIVGLSGSQSENWHKLERLRMERDAELENPLWFAVPVPPQKEAIAEMCALTAGLSVYWPSSVRAARTEAVSVSRRSVVPGLLFVAVEGTSSHHEASYELMRELHRAKLADVLFRVGSGLIAVPADEMAKFRSFLADRNDGKKRELPTFRQGMSVRITEGAFSELTATVTADLGADLEVQLALEAMSGLFQSAAAIKISKRMVEVLRGREDDR